MEKFSTISSPSHWDCRAPGIYDLTNNSTKLRIVDTTIYIQCMKELTRYAQYKYVINFAEFILWN